MLEVVDVTRRFGGVVAVSGVSFGMQAGEVLGLIGPNGAGKTTLFNIVAGVLAPNEGRVLFNGRDISKLGPAKRCQLGLARTHQIPRPFSSLTVEENVVIGALASKKTISMAKLAAAEALRDVSMEHMAQVEAGTLPLGRLKRLEVARALATGPKLLLLDEICGGLNPAETNEMIDLINKLAGEGKTIIVVEHNIGVITRTSTHVIVLDFGRKIAEGTPQDVVKDQDVISAYLGRGVRRASS